MRQFDPQQSARRQKYVTVGSGTTQAVLTHESVDAEYIALWLYARAEEAASGPHPDVNRFKRYRDMASIVCPGMPSLEPSPLAKPVVWTEDDQHSAALQGWGVSFDADLGWGVVPEGSVVFKFDTPLMAGLWVRNQAIQGDELARKAVDFVQQRKDV